VSQVGYLLGLYRDARPTEYKRLQTAFTEIPVDKYLHRREAGSTKLCLLERYQKLTNGNQSVTVDKFMLCFILVG